MLTVLDCHEFDTNTSKETRMTWYNSSIRRWLNNKFYNDAFCTEEKYMIKNTEIEKEDFDLYPKQSMDDMIFLLPVRPCENMGVPGGCVRKQQKQGVCRRPGGRRPDKRDQG